MCPSHTRVSGLAHPTAAHPPPVGLSPARVVFAAADTRVPRLLPLPCCYALARQLSNSRPLSTSVVLLYSWQASARDSGRIIHTGTVRHAAAAAAAQARRRRRRRRQRHTGWLVQGGLKRDRRLPARGAPMKSPTAPPSMYSLAQ